MHFQKYSFYLRIEDILLEAGSGFTFPSQTLYTQPDEGINNEQGKQDKLDVKQWRSKDPLPFPDFYEEHRNELLNQLEYPPEGSQSTRPLSGAALQCH